MVHVQSRSHFTSPVDKSFEYAEQPEAPLKVSQQADPAERKKYGVPQKERRTKGSGGPVLVSGENQLLIRADRQTDRRGQAQGRGLLVQLAILANGVAGDRALGLVLVGLLFDGIQEFLVFGELLPRRRGARVVDRGDGRQDALFRVEAERLDGAHVVADEGDVCSGGGGGHGDKAGDERGRLHGGDKIPMCEISEQIDGGAWSCRGNRKALLMYMLSRNNGHGRSKDVNSHSNARSSGC